MPHKRDHDDTTEDASYTENHHTTQSRPHKRRKQDTTTTETTYTIAEVQTFKDEIRKIKDWTSNTIDPKHVQVVYWFDVAGLSKTECAERYPNQDGNPCSSANIFKIYNKYAPRFYMEKGLTFIPLRKRVVGRAPRKPVISSSQKERSVGNHSAIRKNYGSGGYKPSRLDHELEKLFYDLPQAAELSVLAITCSRVLNTKHNSEVHGLQEETEPITVSDYDQDVLMFICQVGRTGYGCSEAIKVRRACAIRYSNTIREALQKDPSIRDLRYGPEISPDTVARFVACCSPTLQESLPTHVTTRLGTFEQAWSMSELRDLYVLAVSMDAPQICDMIIDRWHGELQRSEPREVQDEFGDTGTFSMLDFGPEWLNFLLQNDERGLSFFLNVLITHGQAGYDLLCDMNLGNYHNDVKKALISTIENGLTIDLAAASPEIVCSRFHHHDAENVLGCYKQQTLHPLRTEALQTDLAKGPASRPNVLDHSCDHMDSDEEDGHQTLQITVSDFPWVHNRYPQHGEDDEIPSDYEYIPDRLRQYRNAHQEGRIHYSNPVFNAHHDSEEVCKEKIRLVKEAVQSFRDAGIDLGDAEMNEAFGGREDTPDEGDVAEDVDEEEDEDKDNDPDESED